MDAPGYLRIIGARWYVLLLGGLVGGLLAGMLALTMTPVYTTETRFFISTSAGDTTGSAYEGNLFSQQRVTSYAELIRDQRITSAVIEDLGLDMETWELAEQIEASVVPNTVILAVTVTDTSPTRAVEIAESIGKSFAVTVRDIETPAGADTAAVSVYVSAAPLLPDAPTAPRPLRDVAVGLVLGVLLAAAGLLVRARLDTRIRTGEQATSVGGAPSLGMTLVDKELSDQKVLTANSTSPTLESLRRIRTNLDFIDVDNPPKVLVVTSAMPGEGKTTLAANLAVQIAGEGRRVTLIEADLRRPRLVRYLGLISGAGLTNVLNGSADLDEVLQHIGDDRLTVLASGPIPPDPSSMLGSASMRHLLETLKARSDVVIIDAPPLLPVADTSGLATLSDGVILCVRWGSTRVGQLRQSRLALDRVGARLLGVVLTFVARSAAADEGHGYGYSYNHERVERSPYTGWRRRLARPEPAARRVQLAPLRPARRAPRTDSPVPAPPPGQAGQPAPPEAPPVPDARAIKARTEDIRSPGKTTPPVGPPVSAQRRPGR